VLLELHRSRDPVKITTLCRWSNVVRWLYLERVALFREKFYNLLPSNAIVVRKNHHNLLSLYFLSGHTQANGKCDGFKTQQRHEHENEHFTRSSTNE